MKWTLAVLCASQLLFTAATHAQLKTTTPELLLDSRIEARTSVTAEAGQDTLLRSRLSTADKKYVSLVVGLAVEGLAKTAAASDL